jgi:hypothetical protein
MIRAQPSPSFGSWPSAKRPRDLRFCRLAPGAVTPPTRRDSPAARQRDAAPGRVRAFRRVDGSSVRARAHLPPSPSRTASSGRRPSSPSVIRLRAPSRTPRSLPASSVPSRSPSERSSGLPFAPSAPLREVPEFGAVLIARPARVTDRGAGLPADLRSVPEPAAGGEEAVALGGLLAAKRWITVTSSVVC